MEEAGTRVLCSPGLENLKCSDYLLGSIPFHLDCFPETAVDSWLPGEIGEIA